MRCHLLLVSEKKIKMLKPTFATQKVKYYRWRQITFFAHTAHITNICMKSGLIIFNTLAVTLRTGTCMTQDAGHRTQDGGHRTQDT